MKIDFLKYQGLGNDFIIVDDHLSQNSRVLERKDVSAFSQFLCDRHFGIGADGVLFLTYDRSQNPKMIVYNSDGSKPEMCGNGLRCVAQYLKDRGISVNSKTKIITDAGIKEIEYGLDGRITITMGKICFESQLIPVHSSHYKMSECIKQNIDVDGKKILVSAANIGNPHLLVHSDNTQHLAEKLQKHEFFPNQMNVEFYTIHDNRHISLQVFERGVGWTLACGTGACASVAMLFKSNVLLYEGDIQKSQSVRVDLPGGSAYVSIAKDYSQSWLTGTAKLVFSGNIEISETL